MHLNWLTLIPCRSKKAVKREDLKSSEELSVKTRTVPQNKGGLCRGACSSCCKCFTQVIAFQSILAKEMRSQVWRMKQIRRCLVPVWL